MSVHHSAEVIGFTGENQIVERLQELGFYVGARLTVASRAPWGGPLVVHFGQTTLALREEEAKCVIINPL